MKLLTVKFQITNDKNMQACAFCSDETEKNLDSNVNGYKINDAYGHCSVSVLYDINVCFRNSSKI